VSGYGLEPEPRDVLTRLAEDMLDLLAGRAVGDGVRAIVLLSAETVDGRTAAGSGFHGYETAADALAELLGHAEALADAIGLEFHVMDLPRGGQG
jgi:hypothetical protein